MKGVDATDFIATKTKWQGNVMEEWYLKAPTSVVPICPLLN